MSFKIKIFINIIPLYFSKINKIQNKFKNQLFNNLQFLKTLINKVLLDNNHNHTIIYRNLQTLNIFKNNYILKVNRGLVLKKINNINKKVIPRLSNSLIHLNTIIMIDNITKIMINKYKMIILETINLIHRVSQIKMKNKIRIYLFKERDFKLKTNTDLRIN